MLYNINRNGLKGDYKAVEPLLMKCYYPGIL